MSEGESTGDGDGDGEGVVECGRGSRRSRTWTTRSERSGGVRGGLW